MARSSELPEQWHTFVRGLTRLYEETGLRITDEDHELYAPKGINGEHFFPLPIWQAQETDDDDDDTDDDIEDVAGEYLSPAEIDRREHEARCKAAEEQERLEFERLKAKYGRSAS